MTRLYTPAERRAHLRAFADALADLVAALDRVDHFPGQRAAYAEAHRRALRFLEAGFQQPDLNELARLPRLFNYQRGEPGDEVFLAPWFHEVEALERRVSSARLLLRAVGET